MSSIVRNLNEDLYFLTDCKIEKRGRLQTSRTGNYIHKFDTETYELRLKQAKALGKFFSYEWYELLYKKINDIPVYTLLGLTKDEIEYFLTFTDREKPLTYYFGLDLAGNSPRITDLNSDRSCVFGFQNEIIEIFQNNNLLPDNGFKYKGIYNGLTKLIDNLGSSTEPKDIFVLYDRNDQFILPLRSFAKKMGFRVGDYLAFDDSKSKFVIRQVKSEKIFQDVVGYSKILDSIKNKKTLFMNPLISYLSGHKGWITILQAFNKISTEWFPESWLITGNIVLSSSGNTAPKKDFFNNNATNNDIDVFNRKGLILKKGLSAGGQDVFIGQDLKRYQWSALLEHILNSSSETWVLEKKIDKREVNVEVTTWDGYQDDIESLENSNIKQLNILERIYSIYPFDEIYGEVFATAGNKVNASGYTFPVQFPY